MVKSGWGRVSRHLGWDGGFFRLQGGYPSGIRGREYSYRVRLIPSASDAGGFGAFRLMNHDLRLTIQQTSPLLYPDLASGWLWLRSDGVGEEDDGGAEADDYEERAAEPDHFGDEAYYGWAY